MCTYKAAILFALSSRQIFTPVQLGMLNKLCNVLHRRRPLKLSPIPTWNIGLVLRAFTLATFEPLDTASLKAMTYKVFEITALTLGARRCELCTLLCGQFVRPAEDWSFVFL